MDLMVVIPIQILKYNFQVGAGYRWLKRQDKQNTYCNGSTNEVERQLERDPRTIKLGRDRLEGFCTPA